MEPESTLACLSLKDSHFQGVSTRGVHKLGHPVNRLLCDPQLVATFCSPAASDISVINYARVGFSDEGRMFLPSSKGQATLSRGNVQSNNVFVDNDDGGTFLTSGKGNVHGHSQAPGKNLAKRGLNNRSGP